MDHQTITAERGRRAADLRAAAVAVLEQQSTAAGVLIDIDDDTCVAAGPKAAILMLLSGAGSAPQAQLQAAAPSADIAALVDKYLTHGVLSDMTNHRAKLIALANEADQLARQQSAPEGTDDFMVYGRAGNRRADLEGVLRDALTARQQAAPAAIPEGWKLVPKNPTPNMVEAYNSTVSTGFAGSPAHADHVWSAMLAAAPAHPAPIEAQGLAKQFGYPAIAPAHPAMPAPQQAAPVPQGWEQVYLVWNEQISSWIDVGLAEYEEAEVVDRRTAYEPKGSK